MVAGKLVPTHEVSAIPVPRPSPEELKNVLTHERRSLLPEPVGAARDARTGRRWTWPILLAAIALCVVLALIFLR